jgi:hypothetical protein
MVVGTKFWWELPKIRDIWLPKLRNSGKWDILRCFSRKIITVYKVIRSKKNNEIFGSFQIVALRFGRHFITFREKKRFLKYRNSGSTLVHFSFSATETSSSVKILETPSEFRMSRIREFLRSFGQKYITMCRYQEDL